MKTRLLLLTAFALVFVQGCATVKPQITADAVDFNKAVENTNNQVTFLNVLRSYHRSPRHYTSISDIKGNFTVSASTGLSSVISRDRTKVSQLVENAMGGSSTNTTTNAADTLTPTLGAAYSTNPNYTIAVLESQEFYGGILKPISLQTLTLFRQQGWDSELLANLLFEHIVLTIRDGKRHAVYKIENDSRERGWTTLAKQLQLQTKSTAAKHEVLVITSSLNAEGLAKLVEQKLSVRRCTNKDVNLNCKPESDYIVFRKGSSSVGLNLFRSKSLSTEIGEYIEKGYQAGDNTLLKEYLTKCARGDRGTVFFFGENLSESEVEPSNAKEKICESQLHVSTRSTDGIVYYLGEYLRGVLDDKHSPITIGESNDPLFVVGRGGDSAAALSTTMRNERYYIPKQKGGRSLQVLSLVQQLLNLNKKSEDLPKAQLIQIQ